MSSLAETQTWLRDGVVSGGFAVAPALTGGRDPVARLAIHRRNHEESLVRALTTKFPATCWLLGGRAMQAVSRAFIASHPPVRPCIAEYGEELPGFLVSHLPTAVLDYAPWVARLDWLLGRIAVEIDRPALPIGALAGVAERSLPDLRLALQPGLAFIHPPWPVDDVLGLFLSGNPPEAYCLERHPVWLEVRGARGKFRMLRLEPSVHAFRAALREGRDIASAAEAATAEEEGFEAGRALATLFGEGLVTAFTLEDGSRGRTVR